MALQVYEADDTTLVEDLPFTNVEAGFDSDVLEVHVWNDKGNDAGQDLENLLLLLQTEHPTIPNVWLRSGVPPQDELWGRGRIIGFTNTGDPTWSVPLSDWLPLGAFAGIPYADHPANCAVHLELAIHPPRTAAGLLVWNWMLAGMVGEYAMALPPALAAMERGILHGIGDTNRSYIVTGCEVSVSSPIDDEVHVAAGFWQYRGSYYGKITTDHTLDQNDGAAAALATGQSYWAVLTLAAGVVVVTKGLKGAAPTKPTPPAGQPFLKFVQVLYNGGGSEIDDPDLDGETLYGRYRMLASGGNLRIHPGQAIGPGSMRFAHGPQDLPIDDDSTRYVHQLSSGLFTATSDGVPPVGALDWWTKVVKASGVITDIDDRRTYAGRTHVLRLAGELGGSPALLDRQLVGVERLVLEAIIYRVSDNGSGTSGLTRLDLEVNGDTVYTDFATDDQRPTFAYDAPDEDLVVTGKVHQVTELRQGDIVDLLSVAHPSGGAAPASAEATLICREP